MLLLLGQSLIDHFGLIDIQFVAIDDATFKSTYNASDENEIAPQENEIQEIEEFIEKNLGIQCLPGKETIVASQKAEISLKCNFAFSHLQEKINDESIDQVFSSKLDHIIRLGSDTKVSEKSPSYDPIMASPKIDDPMHIPLKFKQLMM